LPTDFQNLLAALGSSGGSSSTSSSADLQKVSDVALKQPARRHIQRKRDVHQYIGLSY
jgi:hypothetical protein